MDLNQERDIFDQVIQQTRIMYAFIILLVLLLTVFMLGLAASLRLQIEILTTHRSTMTIDKTTAAVHH